MCIRDRYIGLHHTHHVAKPYYNVLQSLKHKVGESRDSPPRLAAAAAVAAAAAAAATTAAAALKAEEEEQEA